MIELLLTLAVTVFGIMGSLALHASLAKGSTGAAHAQEAVAIGARTMETLRKKRPADLSIAIMGAAATPPYSASMGTELGRNGFPYTVTATVTAPSANLWLMRVEVSFTDDTTGDVTTLPLELVRPDREAL